MNPFRTEDPQLNTAIAHCYTQLMTLQPNSTEFKEVTTRLTELNALKNQGLDTTKLAIAATNVFIALKVLRFEDQGVIGTKLFSFMQKF